MPPKKTNSKATKLSPYESIFPLLVAMGTHLNRIEKHLGLEPMTQEETKKYLMLENGEEPMFTTLKRHGDHILSTREGGSFFSDLFNVGKSIISAPFNAISGISKGINNGIQGIQSLTNSPLGQAAKMALASYNPKAAAAVGVANALGFGDSLDRNNDGELKVLNQPKRITAKAARKRQNAEYIDNQYTDMPEIGDYITVRGKEHIMTSHGLLPTGGAKRIAGSHHIAGAYIDPSGKMVGNSKFKDATQRQMGIEDWVQ